VKASLTVDMADYQVSADPDTVLSTYALGSCIAVMLYDARRRMAGMLHYMLPVAECAPTKAAEKPTMFADTGIPVLVAAMERLGATRRTMVCKVAGGAKRYQSEASFDIGRRNYIALKKVLWKAGIVVASEDVGGTIYRTVRMHVDTGAVFVSSDGRTWEL
jgi:chemotaxis protein CheD